MQDLSPEELKLSAFFGGKEEPAWSNVQNNVQWFRALLENYGDVGWLLKEFGRAYLWWLENPKRRQKEISRFVGNWLRREMRDRATKEHEGRDRRRTTYFAVPPEPDKYEGLGVIHSAYACAGCGAPREPGDNLADLCPACQGAKTEGPIGADGPSGDQAT